MERRPVSSLLRKARCSAGPMTRKTLASPNCAIAAIASCSSSRSHKSRRFSCKDAKPRSFGIKQIPEKSDLIYLSALVSLPESYSYPIFASCRKFKYAWLNFRDAAQFDFFPFGLVQDVFADGEVLIGDAVGLK